MEVCRLLQSSLLSYTFDYGTFLLVSGDSTSIALSIISLSIINARVMVC